MFCGDELVGGNGGVASVFSYHGKLGMSCCGVCGAGLLIQDKPMLRLWGMSLLRLCES